MKTTSRLYPLYTDRLTSGWHGPWTVISTVVTPCGTAATPMIVATRGPYATRDEAQEVADATDRIEH